MQGSKGAYTMPLDVVCLGPPGSRRAVQAALALAGFGLQEVDAGEYIEGGGGGTPGGASQRGPSRLPASDMDRRLERMFSGDERRVKSGGL